MEDHQAERIENIDVRIPMPWGHIAGRWYGNRSVRPLLAVHGWLDNLGTWNNLLPLLPKHIGVLCIDMPGQGRSSKLPRGIVYHEFDFLRVILHIMNAYNWNKVSLLSHSLGSRLAFVFTAIFPHKVDLIIGIDFVGLRFLQPNVIISTLRLLFEKFMVEDDRQNSDSFSLLEPPTYTFDEMEKRLYESSGKSVELENCKYLLERSITKSQIHPRKYYFSRDGRVKYSYEMIGNPSLSLELAKRVHNIAYCLIKASKSDIINENSREIIAILCANNPNFEFHEVKGTHHVQLSNAAGVAAIINPFISRHRPPLVESWTIDGSNIGETITSNKTKNKTQNLQNNRFKANSKL